MTAMKSSEPQLRVFLFGTRGYMSVILDCLKDNAVIPVGLCTNRPPALVDRLRAIAGRSLRKIRVRGRHDFAVSDPFGRYPEPWTMAETRGIPVFPYQEIRTPGLLAGVRAASPDLIMVAGFPKLIPTTVLEAARVAAINLHPSLLPHHRGGTPNRWIVRKGEAQTGITAHWLDATFDTGDILEQWPISVSAEACWGDVEAAIVNQLPAAAASVVRRVRSGDLPRIQQAVAPNEYEPPLRGRHACIDWAWASADISRLCRAMRPKSGALTSLNDAPICIWSIRAVAKEGTVTGSRPAPGTILARDGEGFPLVVCGDQELVRVEEIVEYGSVVSARNARDLAPGLRFDTPAWVK